SPATRTPTTRSRRASIASGRSIWRRASRSDAGALATLGLEDDRRASTARALAACAPLASLTLAGCAPVEPLVELGTGLITALALVLAAACDSPAEQSDAGRDAGSATGDSGAPPGEGSGTPGEDS